MTYVQNMPSGRTVAGPRGTKKVQKVVIVKPKRHRRRAVAKITRNVLSRKSVVKMQYADTITIDAGAAAITSHVFRANGLFDPDFTGTGHQPFTHDTMQTLYAQYRVLACSLKVTPVISNVANGQTSFWGIFLDNDSTLNYSLATAIIEDPRTKSKWGIYNGNSTIVSGSRYSKPLTLMFNAKKDSSPEAADNAVDFGALPLTTNGLTTFFQIWSGSLLGNDPGPMQCLVELTYTVELSSPKQLTQS